MDLVEVQQVDDAVHLHGDRYLTRIYGEREVADCRSQATGAVDAERLAARFAAKEATIKVLRPAAGGINWRDIEVERAPEGYTELRLRGTAAAAAEAQQLGGFTLSLTHDAGLAAAVVLAQTAQGPTDV